MAGLDVQDVINDFDSLDLEQQPTWNYASLYQELQQNQNGALLGLNTIKNQLEIAFGEYGSINLGNGGSTYKAIRRVFTRIRQGQLPLAAPLPANSFPLLREFLTDPVINLPAYSPAGPGGQGDSKQLLNECVIHVRDRVVRSMAIASGNWKPLL